MDERPTMGPSLASTAGGTNPVPPAAIEDPSDVALALACEGLCKRFDATVALDGLSFSARAGEVHAVLGENGAGKSTFVKILGGTHRADSGELAVFGERLQLRSPRDAQRAGIWIAYQELSLASELTVGQNIWLTVAPPTRLGMLGRNALRRQTLEALAEWDAPAIDPDEKVRNLSVGQRQVVEIMRAVSHDPRVVVFDESTAALLASETDWALKTARRLASNGVAVLFISHRIGEIRRVSDRVTVFRHGRHVASGTTAELTDDAMVEAMLGRKPQALYPPARHCPSEEIALDVRDLSHGRRLAGIDFSVRRGELLGVGGLQGQGQSELLAALFGVLPSKGTITVGGTVRRLRSPGDALRAGIGLVPEDRRLEGLMVNKTVRENLALPSLSRVSRGGFISPWREAQFARGQIAAANVMADSPEQVVATLSGGNQQKVVVSKLLALDTPIVLLDDFTRGIDVGTKADLFELLRELTASGRSIVFHSSDSQELVHMCDRILVLRAGRVSAVLSGDQRSEKTVMRAAFGLPLESRTAA